MRVWTTERSGSSRAAGSAAAPTGLAFSADGRYAYATEFTVDNAGGQHLLKHDLQTFSTRALQLGPDLKPGEFVFVPKQVPSGQGAQPMPEDAGWLIGYAFNVRTGLGEFHVVDAEHMQPQAVVEVPAPIPMGFHGNWVPAASLR